MKENEHYVHNITKGFDFYLHVLDMYLNCSFYDEVKIEQILNFKQKILDREYNVKNNIKWFPIEVIYIIDSFFQFKFI